MFTIIIIKFFCEHILTFWLDSINVTPFSGSKFDHSTEKLRTNDKNNWYFFIIPKIMILKSSNILYRVCSCVLYVLQL